MLFLTLIALTSAQPILWLSNLSNAKSTVSNISTTLYTTIEPSGAQFPYTKKASSYGLVDVYLTNEKYNVNLLLQSSFDMIAQKCSCYWIAAKDQLISNRLPTSDQYRLDFRNAQGDIVSGYFGMAWGDKYVEGEIDGVAPSSSSSTSTAPPSYNVDTTPNSKSVSNTAASTGTSHNSATRRAITNYFGFLVAVFLVFLLQ